MPIFFELFIETVYPVPEGITCGVVTFLQNLFMGLLLVFLSFYCSGESAAASGLYLFVFSTSNTSWEKHIMDFLQLHSENLYIPVITDS